MDERDVMAKWEHLKATLTVSEMNELLKRGELLYDVQTSVTSLLGKLSKIIIDFCKDIIKT